MVDEMDFTQEDVHNHHIRQSLSKLRIPLASWMIVPFACALVVIGAKCWMIAHYGSPTPFWDQWDAEGALLYPKYLGGTLQISDLIAPHNEHRILVTRLWSLLLLDLGGYWDTILQMLANALILGGFVALFIAAFRPILDCRSWLVFALFSMVIFALPLGWENTLIGLNSHFYFLLLFTVFGLVVIIDAAAFAPRWWLAVLLLILSYFCVASGALTAAAAFAVGVVQFVVGRRSGLRELLALAILAGLTVAMVFYTPVLAGHATLKAHSVGHFIQALMGIMSWPASKVTTFIVWATVCAILTQAPAWLMIIDTIRTRPPLTDRRWLAVALVGWVTLQALAMAYGRAAAGTPPRYLDLLAVGWLLNGACLLYLLSACPALRLRRRLAIGAIAAWLLPALAGTTMNIKYAIRDMAESGASGRTATENLRSYLDTGDIRVLQNKGRLDISYPDPQRLAMIASIPVIRALLPPALVGEASAARAQQRGLARVTGRPIEALKDFALRWGVLLIPIGLALFLAGLMMQLRRERKTASS
jgi:hypothetical protein